MIDTVGARNHLLHYSKSPSWVQDRADAWSSYRLVRGGKQARTKDSYSARDRGPLVGFRPCLEPLNLSTFEYDSSRFSDIKDGELLTFGTICILDHKHPFPVPKTRNSEGDIPHNYASLPVCISDSVDDAKYNIQWVKAGTLLVADRNLLKNVSWEQLDTWGLVFGDDPKAVHKDPPNHSLDDLISQAKSISDQLSRLTSDLQKHKNNLER